SPRRTILMHDLSPDPPPSITEEAKQRTPPAPGEEGSRRSPLSSVAAAARFVEQDHDTGSQGATLLAGGKRYDGGGAYVEPVVLTDVKKGMRGYYEELFGPAVIVHRVSSEEEAVEMANDTPLGLGAAVFSSDIERAARVGSQVDAGLGCLHAPEGTREYLPFGGVKRSGVGRELGPLAMDEFVNKQMVYKQH